MNMEGICVGMKKIWPRLNIFKFEFEKGQPGGQGQVWVWWCEPLMTRSVVCEYERNPSRNEEVMAKIKFFDNFTSI